MIWRWAAPVLGAMLAVCGVRAGAQEPAVRRPNILFCFADDWGRYAGAYARLDRRPSPNQVVQTPHIDRLAREGVLFRSAFAPAPSCTPCRSSLVSGRYFFNCGRGAILQGAQWDSSIPAWPLLLQKSGYHIGKFTKVWSPGAPADAPYGGQRHAYEKAGRDYNNFSENATALVRSGVTVEAARTRLLNEVKGNFDAFLAARPGKEPFCFWFGPTLVHRKWEKGSGQALWGIDPDRLKGKLPRFLPDVPEVRADFADYLGEIQAWDAGVGVLLKKLEEAGELNNTLIVVSGDHGAPGFPGGKCNLYDFGTGVSLVARMPGGKGGRVVDDLVSLMDLGPTFLEAAGAALPAGMHGRSLLAQLSSRRSGRIDPSRDAVITGRERHVADAREDFRPYPQRALRTERFLYVRNFKPERWPLGSPKGVTDTSEPTQDALENNTYAAFADMDSSPTKAWLVANRKDPKWAWHYRYAFDRRPEEELFDLKKDPDQIRNVAAEPEYAGRKKELAERLMRTLREAGDPRVTSDRFEQSPFTDPNTPAPAGPRRLRPGAGQ